MIFEITMPPQADDAEIRRLPPCTWYFVCGHIAETYENTRVLIGFSRPASTLVASRIQQNTLKSAGVPRHPGPSPQTPLF